MTSETDKELLLRVAQAVCHEEQMTVWSGDFATALGANGYLRDLSYDEVVELHQTIQLELQRIIASAMQHPEASRVLREAAEGGWSVDMEDAPLDGTRIDIWARRETTGTCSRYVDCRWGRQHFGTEPYGEKVWLGLQDRYSIITPLRWKPVLPPPPSPEPATHSLEPRND